MRDLSWSRRLITLLLEELYVSDDFDRLVGSTSRIPPNQYPQLVAIALVLRHSWCPRDLAHTARRLGLSLDLMPCATHSAQGTHSTPEAAATAASAPSARGSQSRKPSHHKKGDSRC